MSVADLQPIIERRGDRPVFIIGGGPSLENVGLTGLQNRFVIGCNDAYVFGEGIVDVCHFGDHKWFTRHRPTLYGYGGFLTTSVHALMEEEDLIHVARENHGWHKDKLGWNGNTGCEAINLALLLGAQRIYLLGFDMKLGPEGESNWHVNVLDNPTEEVHYARYKDSFQTCVLDWKAKWPEVEIVNLNPDSALECFPKVPWGAVF